MTEKTSIIITDEDGQHTIMITPVNVSMPGGMLYATGEYKLTEGDVGIGLIKFDDEMQWEYEGVSDLDSTQIDTIANFILNKDKPLLDDSPLAQPAVSIDVDGAFIFTTIYQGEALDIQVLMHYPLYDVIINGVQVAQLQQDHHSNWFVADGALDDDLVQETGRRIVAEMAN